MNITTRILTNISSVEPCTFSEMLQGMGDDAPERGDKWAWGRFFGQLESLEKMELITVEHVDGKIESLQLTTIGAELAREALQENR